MNPHQSTQCAQLLSPLFQQMLEQISDFTKYLNQIKQTIADNDKEQLEVLLDNPRLDFASIEQLQLKQQQIVADFGFAQSHEGIDSCVKSCDQAPLSDLYNQLRQQLEQLQSALMINDLLIKKNQQRVRQSIRLLSGYAPVNNNMTYNSSGNTHEENLDSHSLARA